MSRPSSHTVPAHPRPASDGHGLGLPRWQRAWRRWRRLLLGGFSVLVVLAIAWHLQGLDWAGAWRAVQAMPASTLALAAAVAALGHATYGGFDLLARRWLGLTLPAWRMWWSATVSYAFTLNLGSFIGGGPCAGVCSLPQA